MSVSAHNAEPPVAPSIADCGSDARSSQLTEVASSTEAELSEIWAEIGLTDEERSTQLEALIADVTAVFRKKVQEEATIREQYVAEVARLEGEIKATAEMVVEIAPAIPDEETTTLVRRVAWLTQALSGLSEIRAVWEGKIGEALTPLLALWEELGEEVEPGFEDFGSVLDADRLEAVRAKLVEVQDVKAARLEKISDLLDDIGDVFEELEFEPESEFDVCISRRSEELGITRDAIQALEHRKEELAEEKVNRTNRIKDLGDQIQPLWEKLEVPQERRKNFFANELASGLGLRVIKYCEEELAAMKALKQDKLGELIEKARGRIEELWEINGATEQEKVKFKAFKSTETTDDVYEAHEEEIERLEVRAELIGPLIQSLHRFEALFAEREE